jgi:hypothetical protein
MQPIGQPEHTAVVAPITLGTAPAACCTVQTMHAPAAGSLLSVLVGFGFGI